MVNKQTEELPHSDHESQKLAPEKKVIVPWGIIDHEAFHMGDDLAVVVVSRLHIPIRTVGGTIAACHLIKWMSKTIIGESV